MRDQATELRKLVLRSMRREAASAGDAPRLLLMAGGKGGVGTTTLAVNLSVAMALNGARVVLVDADLFRSDVATLCGLSDQANVGDVLTARRDIHEVIQLGPAGVQVIPGLWARGDLTEVSETRLERMIKQLRSLRQHADVVIIDAGNGAGKIAQRFWHAADEIVLTTTPDTMAVMDTYAAIKVLGTAVSSTIRILVNQADDTTADNVFQRLSQSCQRFLSRKVHSLGFVAADSTVKDAARAACPLMFHAPDAQAAKCIQKIATTLCDEKDGLHIGKAA